MKSASATIGAMVLSAEAKKLEDASRSEDIVYVKDKVSHCEELLNKVLEKIGEYVEKN
jgi:HPt (histidine-containing phosphotransfer) domain-containing protein